MKLRTCSQLKGGLTLSWKPHLVELSKKLAGSIGIFYKLRYFVPLNTLITIYYALFYSFLTYGIVVWGATYDNYVQPVFTSQKKVIRAMTSSKQSGHSSPLFSQLKLLKLYDIYKLYISSFIFECQNKTSPIYFSDFFTSVSSIHSYNTQSASHGNLFLIRKNTLQYGLRSISYIGVRIWNNISSDIRNSSVKSFRKKYKEFLLSSYET